MFFFLSLYLKGGPQLKCAYVVKHIVNVLDNHFTYECYGQVYSSVLLKHVLSVRRYQTEIPAAQWLGKFVKSFDYSSIWGHLWCNSYCCRKWTQLPDFTSWMRLFASRLIPLGKVWIQIIISNNVFSVTFSLYKKTFMIFYGSVKFFLLILKIIPNNLLNYVVYKMYCRDLNWTNCIIILIKLTQY